MTSITPIDNHTDCTTPPLSAATSCAPLFCLILAGGKGRRLWPESRAAKPKQFIDFFGSGRTQLQQTYDRFRLFLPPERIFISTNEAYADTVREQLPEAIGDNILAEPLWRNTAPSIAWATHKIHHLCPEAVIAVAPSDQQVINPEAFAQNITSAAEFAACHNTLLVMGVRPTRPEPGYGYIQFKEQIEGDIYSVRTFTEKPDRDFARVFIDSGEFFWNTGIFVFAASHMLASLKKDMPAMLMSIYADGKEHTAEEEREYVANFFSSCPNMSMEQGIVEKSPDVSVMKCNFGWADLGTWHGIYEAEHRNNNDNVVLDSDVILDNAHGNIIKVPKGHLAVINGLNGYIVVEKDDTLLICPREDSSALIRKYSAEVEIR